MPIINDLLNLNLAEVVGQVTTLAAQIVCSLSRPCM